MLNRILIQPPDNSIWNHSKTLQGKYSLAISVLMKGESESQRGNVAWPRSKSLNIDMNPDGLITEVLILITCSAFPPLQGHFWWVALIFMNLRKFPMHLLKITISGTSLVVVQWLRLRAPKAGAPGLIPGQEIRSLMLQLRPGRAK